MRSIVVAIPEEVVIRDQSIERLADDVYVQRLLRHPESKREEEFQSEVSSGARSQISLGEVDECHVSVEERRLDGRPSSDVPHELHLVGQREHVIVPRHVDVEHMKAVLLAQIVGEVHEARRRRLWHTIVNHDDVLVEVVLLSGSGVEQRQKVVWRDKNSAMSASY